MDQKSALVIATPPDGGRLSAGRIDTKTGGKPRITGVTRLTATRKSHIQSKIRWSRKSIASFNLYQIKAGTSARLSTVSNPKTQGIRMTKMAKNDLTDSQIAFDLGVNLGATVMLRACYREGDAIENALAASNAINKALDKIEDAAPDTIDNTTRLFMQETKP